MRKSLIIIGIGSAVFLFILALFTFYPRMPVGEPHGPAGLAVNPATGHMILADSTGHAVFVIEKNNREYLKKVELDNRNGTEAYAGPGTIVPSSKFVYVTNVPNQKVTVLGDRDYDVVRTIDVGDEIEFGVYVPVEEELYFVGLNSNNQIYVINEEISQVIATISVRSTPWGIAHNPDDGLVYVAVLGDGSADSAGVQVINTTNHEVIEMIPIAMDSPRFVAFDSANQRMYVTCGSGDVVVIDSNTRKVIKSISIPDTPLGYYVDEDTGSFVAYPDFTEVLNSSPDRYDWYDSAPSAIIIVPDNYAYVVGEGVGMLSVIDLETMSVITQIPTLPVGYGIAHNPFDGKIYLSHGSQESLYSVSTIPVFPKPK